MTKPQTYAACNQTPPCGCKHSYDAVGCACACHSAEPQTNEPASAPVAGERIHGPAIRHGEDFYGDPIPASHSSLSETIKQLLHDDTLTPLKWEQGFVTSSGRYVDRKEAKVIAAAAGQIVNPISGGNALFSEELWIRVPVAPVAEKTEAMDLTWATDDPEGCCCDKMCSGNCSCVTEILSLRAAIAERDQKIADLTAERDAQIYCTTCGNCGEDGCCNPGKCVKVQCLYGVQSAASYTEAQTAIATLESSAKEMQSTIEAQAREIEAYKQATELHHGEVRQLQTELEALKIEYHVLFTDAGHENAALRDELEELQQRHDRVMADALCHDAHCEYDCEGWREAVEAFRKSHGTVSPRQLIEEFKAAESENAALREEITELKGRHAAEFADVPLLQTVRDRIHDMWCRGKFDATKPHQYQSGLCERLNAHIAKKQLERHA